MQSSTNIRVITWNIGGGLAYVQKGRRTARRARMMKTTEEIGSVLRKSKSDIIGLQEVHFQENGFDQAAVLAKIGGYSYLYSHTFHDSHLDKELKMGLAILSKYPLVDKGFTDLPNPGITINREDDTVWKTHNKGLISTSVKIGHTYLRFHNLHLFPFWKIGQFVKQAESIAIYDALNNAIAGQELSQSIIVGDFNQDSLLDTMRVFKEGLLTDIEFDRFTYLNHQSHPDHIAYGKNIHCLGSRVLDNYQLSDHLPCEADFKIDF